MLAIDRIKQVKAMILHQPFSFPGGYAHRCILSDGSVLCNECVRTEWQSLVYATLHEPRNGWAIEGVDVLWEGPANQCAHCYVEIPTEYGDPDEGQGLE